MKIIIAIFMNFECKKIEIKLKKSIEKNLFRNEISTCVCICICMQLNNLLYETFRFKK